MNGSIESKKHPKPAPFSNLTNRSIIGTICARSTFMPRGSKTKYTEKQKRQAEHIEKSYEQRGASKEEAEKRAWQTINKQSGGGEKSGSGRIATARAKQAARKESGRRAARSRKIGSSRVQRTPTRHKASSSVR
jgi:hypothetical protein